jgi:hypothetical protein
MRNRNAFVPAPPRPCLGRLCLEAIARRHAITRPASPATPLDKTSLFRVRVRRKGPLFYAQHADKFCNLSRENLFCRAQKKFLDPLFLVKKMRPGPRP